MGNNRFSESGFSRYKAHFFAMLYEDKKRDAGRQEGGRRKKRGDARAAPFVRLAKCPARQISLNDPSTRPDSLLFNKIELRASK